MSKLTDNQKHIVDSIISEFYKINDDNQRMTKGRLIDFSGIIHQQQEDLKTRAQIEAQNKAYSKMLSDTVAEHMTILNDDLYHLGLWAFYTYDNKDYKHDICIGILGQSAPSRWSFSNSMRIRYVLSSEKTVSFNSGIQSITENTNNFRIRLDNSDWGGHYKFNSLESMVESREFKNILKELYNKSN